MDGMQAIDPHSGTETDAETGADSGAETTHGTAAAQLLLHAQQVADELRNQAEQQAAEATALAQTLESESRRLHDEATTDREAAGRARAQAEALLADASREARQSVS